MTEDMSRAKAVCVFCGGYIVRCGNGWSHTAMHDNRYNHEGTPYLPVASRLPAEPKVEPVERESCRFCRGTGRIKWPGIEVDCGVCNAIVQTKEAEGGGVEQPKFKHFCKEWDGMEIDETWPEFEACLCFPKPKEAAPEADGPLNKRFVKILKWECTIRDRRLYEGKIGEVVHTYIEPASEWSGKPEYLMTVVAIKGLGYPIHCMPDTFEEVPEPATEGAPEIAPKRKISQLEMAAIYGSGMEVYWAAKRVFDIFTGGHNPTELQLSKLAGCLQGFEYHWTPTPQAEPKAEGAEKVSPKRPQRTETFGGDCYKPKEVEAYMDALESRNAKLEKELEIHKTRHHGLTDLQEVKAQLVWTEREVERLKADLRAMTIDRDLWQEEHAGDCPCACQLEALQAEISSSEPPQSIANRYYLLGLHYTGPKHPEPCAPPYQPLGRKV